jgi:hypothetical protein
MGGRRGGFINIKDMYKMAVSKFMKIMKYKKKEKNYAVFYFKKIFFLYL